MATKPVTLLAQSAVLARQASPRLELQGYVMDVEFFMKQGLDRLGQGLGVSKGFPVGLYMRLEMEIPIVHPPEMNVMNIADSGQCFQGCLQFVQNDRRRHFEHQDIDGALDDFPALPADVDGDQQAQCRVEQMTDFRTAKFIRRRMRELGINPAAYRGNPFV